MSKINREARLYLALIGVNLIFLALFFFIIGLLKYYGESPILPIIEITFIVMGSLMIIIGFSGEICTVDTIDLSVNMLKKYALADNIETSLIR